MPKANSIKPFPRDIDRDEFGQWLSGFTDGEGCFWLGICRNKSAIGKLPSPRARFIITLRQDDTEALRLIQSYFQVGNVRPCHNEHHTKSKPAMTFSVSNTPDLSRVIIPHFHKFPLWSKKARDFIIWEKGILILSQMKELPSSGTLGVLKWTPKRLESFSSLVTKLRNHRAFILRGRTYRKS